MRFLIIEEDVVSREVLTLMLANKFDVTVLDNMENVEKAITSSGYEIILMDMQCSQYDALGVCKLVASESLSYPPLIIGLGEDTSEETIRTIFEAGAFDYFVKPYNVVLFYESLQRLVTSISDYKILKENDVNSRDTLHIALSQGSYYGFAFDLLSEINQAKSIQGLAQTVLKGMSSKGIHCAVQIIDQQGEVYTFEENKDVVGERTLQVFSVVKDQGRILRFGRRLVFNDQHISLLVKTIDDLSDTAYDCVLDIGAKLVPCIEEQLIAVSEHLLLVELQQDIHDIVQKLHLSLTQQVKLSDTILQNVATKMSASFDEMGLTLEQENYLMKLIENELLLQSKTVDIEGIEALVKTVYDKIFTLQAETEKDVLHNSQFGDIDFF